MLGFKGSELSEVNKDTPEVTIYSNGGLAVRQLRHCRDAVGEAASIRIQLQRYDSSNHLKRSIDPRLSESYLENPREMIPNQQQRNTLSGRVLSSENVDAGTRVLFSDVQGQALWEWDSRGTQQAYDYDELRRVRAIYERERGKLRVCRERFYYGEANDKPGKNRIGHLRAHYDTGGYREIPSYSLLGRAQSELRRFIKAEERIDWSADEQENAPRLEASAYSSQWLANGLNEVVSQTNAGGSEQRVQYDGAGQVNEISWRQAGGTERILSQSRVYNANGQLQAEKLGNGVAMAYGYEAATQRLSEKTARRSSDNVLLQCLHYTYDPVGNILSIEDKIQALVHYKNTKIEPIRRYTYDSFYQLLSATGAENEPMSQKASGPEAIVFGNKDSYRLVNYQRNYQYDAGGNLYQRNYQYDAGGNLFEIQHQGRQPYRQELAIDVSSNRGIEKRSGGPSLQESFDGNGNLLYLAVDKPLSWNARKQLQKTVQVARSEGSDEEQYVYDGAGRRLQKTRYYLAGNQRHSERVRYLSGLELREHWQSSQAGEEAQLKERLLVTEIASDIPVKLLHWELGKPVDIENDGVYYSLSDQIGSSQIELNQVGACVSYEDYYPYGGTAIWSSYQIEASYKYKRYSGKERDHSGLYYYGYRYYIPWLGRWVNADPSGISDGLNLFCMVHNNPISLYDEDGRIPKKFTDQATFKDVYPGTRDPTTSKTLHYSLTQIFSLDPARKLAVDIKVFEVGKEIGKDQGFYLMTGPTQAERLIIQAHGVEGEGGILPLGPDTPILTLLSGHKKLLCANIADKAKLPYAKLSHKDITLMSEHAKEDYERPGGFINITGTETEAAIVNYDLTKLGTIPPPETSHYMRHRFEYYAGVVHMSHIESQPFDVLTVRKYRGIPIKASDVLAIAQMHGYKEVIFGFCRGQDDSIAPEIYDIKKSKQLPRPEVKPWNAEPAANKKRRE